ncbi:MAG: hypothetical protein ACUVWR_19190 [Anaerolineae bacterium]
MSALIIPKDMARALQVLTGETRPDTALQLVIRDALAYRRERIEAGIRAFERKYGMTFEQYRQRWETEDCDEDYTWEAERDYLEWEGLVTSKSRLELAALA